MTTLATLVSLRDREVDRAARAARGAAEAAEAAAAEVHAARIALDIAISVRRGAAARRLRRPGDECVSLYLERCELAVAAAERTLADTRQAFMTADQESELARRAWLRAEARRDAMRSLAADENRIAHREVERRAEDDLAIRAGARR